MAAAEHFRIFFAGFLPTSGESTKGGSNLDSYVCNHKSDKQTKQR
jgi:hypothetical protein